MFEMHIFPILLIWVFVSMEKAEGQSSEELFKAYDWNGDKKVTAADIKGAWKGWYNVEWSEEDIMLAFDRDGDGELDFEEFHQYNEDGDRDKFDKIRPFSKTDSQ